MASHFLEYLKIEAFKFFFDRSEFWTNNLYTWCDRAGFDIDQVRESVDKLTWESYSEIKGDLIKYLGKKIRVI